VSDAKSSSTATPRPYLGTLAEVIADSGHVKIDASSNSTATATVNGGSGALGVAVASMTGHGHRQQHDAGLGRRTARRSTPRTPTSPQRLSTA
jgi:hypothetical protein